MYIDEGVGRGSCNTQAIKAQQQRVCFNMMTWEERLVALYCYISEDRRIQYHLAAMRMSNNYQPAFSDEEVMTVYVFGIISGYSKVRQVYD